MCHTGCSEAVWPAERREKMVGSAAKNAPQPFWRPLGMLLICKHLRKMCVIVTGYVVYSG